MGLIELLTRWFWERPGTSPAPGVRPASQEGEDEEAAELLAIEII